MMHRKYRVNLPGIHRRFRLLHISDVHFSKFTTQAHNHHTTALLAQAAQRAKPHCIAVTGDLVSRKPGKTGIQDALACMARLTGIAPVLFSPGNHEMDLPEDVRAEFFAELGRRGVTVLCNGVTSLRGLHFTGLVLPQEIYRGADGSYRNLPACTTELVRRCVGACGKHPSVLLAHNPMGFPAYAEWGADLVLSGHVHGGIVRLPGIGGVLSPERKFFPPYTQGLYSEQQSVMEVSAGVGKLRAGNPAEVVCIDLLPEGGDHGYF